VHEDLSLIYIVSLDGEETKFKVTLFYSMQKQKLVPVRNYYIKKSVQVDAVSLSFSILPYNKGIVLLCKLKTLIWYFYFIDRMFHDSKS